MLCEWAGVGGRDGGARWWCAKAILLICSMPLLSPPLYTTSHHALGLLQPGDGTYLAEHMLYNTSNPTA
jgi:hypothetical protein